MKCILVVDDDFSMRRAMAIMLQGQGYEVAEANDGIQALQMLSQKSIDLAIVDLFLPGRDGIEVAEEIGKRSPHTQILLLTAYGEHARAKEAQQIFKKNYLEKSSLSRELSKKVQEILGESS
jgi:DNA-binding NtrC family response regulator